MSVRIQNRNVGESSSAPLTFVEKLETYKSSLSPSPFAGIVPAVVSSIPSSAVFFTIKDTVKNYLLSPTATPQNLDIVTITILSILIATPFYWSIRTPFEAVKTKAQTITEGEEPPTPLQPSSYYTGYAPNVLYAFPADVIKFCIYEYFIQFNIGGGNQLLNPAVLGAVSTMIAQGVTTPLDIVRNRVMVYGYGEEREEVGYFGQYQGIMDKEGGWEALFKGWEPRVVKASVSGAVQFFVYDAVLRMFGNT